MEIPEIIWLAVTPTPYNNLLFSELHESLDTDFHVVFESTGFADAPWVTVRREDSWISYYDTFLGIDWEVIQKVASSKGVIFFGGWDDWTKRLALAICVLAGHPFVIWTDTPNCTASLKHRLRDFIIEPVLRKAIAVMGTGAMALRELERMGVPTSLLVNFPYWTELPDWDPSNRDGRQFRFACIGRLVPYKGFDVALEAFAALGDEQVALDVIGSGVEGERLRRRAHELGIRDRVCFHGWLEPEEIQGYLATECHCLLHPALKMEPFGVVVIEAMAHGIPVIGSELSGAVYDRIENGVNGYVLPAPIRSTDLADRMKTLVRDREFFQSIQKAARRTAEQWPVQRGVEIVQRLGRTAR